MFFTNCDTRQKAFSLIWDKFLQFTVPHQISLASVRGAQALCSQANMDRPSCQVISFLHMSNPDIEALNFPEPSKIPESGMSERLSGLLSDHCKRLEADPPAREKTWSRHPRVSF